MLGFRVKTELYDDSTKAFFVPPETASYDFVHPEYTLHGSASISNNILNAKDIAGPIKGMAFASPFGSISSISLWYCDNQDPNLFYGCAYPEIWKLSAAVASGLFLIVLGVIFLYARNQSPFVKIKE